ncbi:metal-dependent hydrolase, partial [Pseudomonas aeruginosa]
MALDTTEGLVHMLKRVGVLGNFRVWRDSMKVLPGKDRGVLWLVSVCLDFYTKVFHPWQRNDLHLIQQYRDQVEPEP